ncbi:MAG: hypothetical protein ACFFE8_11315 [Candidatus Heimdallarchaeota archaeon]
MLSVLEAIFIPGSQTALCGQPQIFNSLYGIFVAVIGALGIAGSSIWGLIIKACGIKLSIISVKDTTTPSDTNFNFSPSYAF